jgi:hypothetical protein
MIEMGKAEMCWNITKGLITECACLGAVGWLGDGLAPCGELFHSIEPEHDIIELGGAEDNARGVKVFWLASCIEPSHEPVV